LLRGAGPDSYANPKSISFAPVFVSMDGRDAARVSAQPAFATSGSIDGCLKSGNAEPAERSGAEAKLAVELTKRLDRLVLIIKDFK